MRNHALHTSAGVHGARRGSARGEARERFLRGTTVADGASRVSPLCQMQTSLRD
jgi:hypothetical protein